MSYSYRIEQAIRAAAVLHKDQVRKGNTPLPYITHPVAVAMIVSDYTDHEETIVAALLHDTIEDTDYTPKELGDDFGATVQEIVLGVTRPDLSAEDKHNWKLDKKMYIKQLKNAKKESLMVAAADKIHNMRCIVDEYYDRVSEFVTDFGGALNERLIVYQEISNILNRKLDNPIVDEFNHVFTEYKKFLEHAEKKYNEF